MLQDTSLEWDTANPDGTPTASGNTITAIVKFKDLPDNNSAFGKKKARLKFKGRLVAEAAYEVFFPRDATNHPGSQNGSPNWLFYYTQLVPKLVASSPDLVHGSQSQYDPNTNTIALDNGAIQPYNPHFGTNGELKGIDTFYWAYTHEMQHYKDWHDFWDVDNQGITKWQNAHGQSGPNGNKDGDDFPNSFEDVNGNGVFDAGDPYDLDAVTTSTNATGLADNEDRNCQLHKSVKGDHSKDWADPGMQHKTNGKYDD